MNNNSNNNRTGLWVRDSKSGNSYISGNLKIGDDEYSIRIFKNTKKDKPSQPDYSMFYELKEKKDKPVEDKEVHLTDEDYDKLLSPQESEEIKDEQLELPF